MSLDYATWVEKNWTVKSREGNEWNCLCANPGHDDSHPSMRVNVETGLYLCHGCQFKGKIGGSDGNGLRDLVLQPEDIIARVDELRAQAGQPQTQRVFGERLLDQYRFPTSYWTDQRGFTEKTIEAFDLGYDIVDDAVTIPQRNINGGLLGFTKRFIGEEIHKNDRYRYPRGYRKAENLYAGHLVANIPDSKVAIVEGALDAIPLWQCGIPAVAQLGAGISVEQVRLLMRLGVQEIVLFYDNDRGGRDAKNVAQGWWKTERTKANGDPKWIYKRATDLRRQFLVSAVKWTNADPKDPGDLLLRPGGVKRIQELVATATPLL